MSKQYHSSKELGDALVKAALETDGVGLIENFPTLADVPVGFVGTAQVGTQLYVGDGVSLIPQTPIISRIRSIRPKVAMFGNSIAGRSQLGETTANCWSAWGHLHWIHAFTNAGFDRCRSAEYSANGGSEKLDRVGVYSFSGAANSIDGTNNMLSHLPLVLGKFIDTPDIIYLANMFENDVGVYSFTSTVIIRDAKRLLDLMICRFPNALIIISQPNPSGSYSTAAQHSSILELKAWIATLPALYSNVIVENNVATTIQSGYFDQPITSYVSDTIHPNERGAFVRARAFYTQFSWLFPNALDVPTLAYNAANAKQVYQTNPDFSLSGSPGMNNGQYAGLVLPRTIKSYDWYNDTNYGVTISDADKGISLTITAPSISPTSFGGISIASDAQTVTVANGQSYYSAVKLKILNPSNLLSIYTLSKFSGGTTESHTAMLLQGTFPTLHPEGLSDLLVSGDTFTLVTPPLPPGSTNTVAYTQTKLLATLAVPIGAITSNSPSVQIVAQNLMSTQNTMPQVVTIATTTAYANDTTSPQQLVITGTATFTALTLTRGTVVVSLPLANGIVTLSPGDSVTPTYATGTPVFTVIQQ